MRTTGGSIEKCTRIRLAGLFSCAFVEVSLTASAFLPGAQSLALRVLNTFTAQLPALVKGLVNERDLVARFLAKMDGQSNPPSFLYHIPLNGFSLGRHPPHHVSPQRHP